MAELRAWMLAKLLWNPSLEPSRLREEFIRSYYGPAAGTVEDYLAVTEKAVFASGDNLGCYSPPEAKFLSLDTLVRSWDILKKAERRAAGSIEYARRVKRVEMPVVYAVLAKWDDLRKAAGDGRTAWPWPAKREELLDWFLNSARSEGVTMISEWQTLDDWASKGGRAK